VQAESIGWNWQYVGQPGVMGWKAYGLEISTDEKGRRRIAVNLPRDGRCLRDVFW
jgi:hypothetical protein